MKLFKLTILILSVFVPTQFSEARAQHNRTLSYEPAIVELKGRLTVQLKYGPPNYGESPKTDAKVRVPVLILNEPVNIRAKPGDGFNANAVKGVRRIQLILNAENAYQSLIGKKVFAEGTLFHAFSGHHYTKVVMDVRSIKAALQSATDKGVRSAIVNRRIVKIGAKGQCDKDLSWAPGATPTPKAAMLKPINNTDIFFTRTGGNAWKGSDFEKKCVGEDFFKDDSKPRFIAFAQTDEELAWASYDNGRLLKSIDGGESWCDLLRPEEVWLPGEQGAFFRDLYFIDSTKGWGLKDNGTLFKTEDGGRVWSRIDLNGEKIWNIQFFKDHALLLTNDKMFRIAF